MPLVMAVPSIAVATMRRALLGTAQPQLRLPTVADYDCKLCHLCCKQMI